MVKKKIKQDNAIKCLGEDVVREGLQEEVTLGLSWHNENRVVMAWPKERPMRDRGTRMCSEPPKLRAHTSIV